MSDDATDRARLVGINHLVLEVGDVEDGLAWYRDVFAFDLRGRTDSKAFLDVGDQFLVLAEAEEPSGRNDEARHVGLVVDDSAAVERSLRDLDADVLDSSGLDVRDPWGNRLQIVEYAEVQFTKADHVLAGMGLSDLEKSESAIAELGEKGMAPDDDRS